MLQSLLIMLQLLQKKVCIILNETIVSKTMYICIHLLQICYNLYIELFLRYLADKLYVLMYTHLIPATVDQMSASSWLDKHPWITCQKKKPSMAMTQVACKSKLLSVVRSGACSRIHAQETGWQSGVRSCIMPRLPMHLVQELNTCTVVFKCPDQNDLQDKSKLTKKF